MTSKRATRILYVTLFIAVLAPAVTAGTCLDENQQQCIPDVTEDQCASSGQTYVDAPASEIAACDLGCCCQTGGGHTSEVPEERFLCDGNTYFIKNETTQSVCGDVCGGTDDITCVGEGATCTDGDTGNKCCGENGLFCNASNTCQTLPSSDTCTDSCTLWQDQGCGNGGCETGLMYQNRTCNDATCNQERCVESPQCGETSCGPDQCSTNKYPKCQSGNLITCNDPDNDGCGITTTTTCENGCSNAACEGVCTVDDTTLSLNTIKLNNITNVHLAWTITGCNPGMDYTIQRRRTTTNDIKTGITQTSVNDTGVQEDTTYDYRIIGTGPTGDTTTTDWKTIKTGSSFCPPNGIKSWHCNGDTKTLCDKNRVIQKENDCTGNKYCIVNDNTAECRTPGTSACEQCNYLYGMYSHAYPSMNVDYDGEDLTNPECQQLIMPEWQVCYEDQSNTVTDTYNSCSEAETCLAYNSETTCTNDPCSAAQGGEQCEWKTIHGTTANETLGIGMCGSTGEQICQQCDELPGGCDADTCNALGPCYYNNAENCIPKNSVTCRDYRTSNHCTGGQPVSINVTYDAAQEDRTNGTHDYNQKSMDKYNLNKCYLYGGECFKNADGKTQSPGDCDAGDEQCLQDFTNPNTTVQTATIYGKEDTIGYAVNDNTYTSDAITTYFCINKTTECYPKYGTPKVGLSGYGTATLYYYSQDEGKNLEVVQNKTFQYDTVNPSISTDVDVTTERVGPAAFNHTVTLLVQPSDANLDECTVDYANEQRVIGGPAGLTYTISEAGSQNATVTCTDLAGNENSTNVAFTIEQNPTVTNLTPQGMVNTTTVEITADSQLPGTCQYGLGTAYDQPGMQDMNTTGGTTHKHTLELTDGTHVYNIRCQLENGSQTITTTDPGDQVNFTIDTQPPETTITPPFTGTYRTKSPNNPPVLTCNETGADQYGCGVVHTCEGAECTPTAKAESTKLQLSQDQTNYLFRYYSEDTGGNAHDIQNVSVELDREAPTIQLNRYEAPPAFKNDSAFITGSDTITVDLTIQYGVNVTVSSTNESVTKTSGTPYDTTFTTAATVSISGYEGEEDIEITARDSLGNDRQTTLKYTRAVSPPGQPDITIIEE